jgi:hypothetical protein
MALSFLEHLHRQLSFIRRSCAAYDVGHTDEAIRIATTIRVLIHNTKQSTSLLRHLGADSIDLLSTVIEPSADTLFCIGFGVREATVADGKVTATYAPLFDGPIKAFVPVSTWWNQVVYVLNPTTRLKRKDIVLCAANKDGGAHVDSILNVEYQALTQDGVLGSLVYQKGTETSAQPFTDAHLVAIRQMGHELLNSPSLLSLINT